MELKGYQPAQLSGPSTAGTAPTAAFQAIATQQQSLTNRLAQFANVAQKVATAEAQEQAVEDASRDAMEGKPFYKESVYTVYGQAYNNAASATYAANANIEIQKMSDQLQMEYSNNPLAYATTMDSFVSELGKQAPTEALRATIKIGGTKLKNNVFGNLSQQENIRIKNEQLETFRQESQINIGQIINLRSIGDTAAADILEKKNLAHIDALVNEGVMTPADAQKAIKQGYFVVEKGIEIQNMNKLLEQPSLEDAEELIKSYKETIRQDLDPEEHDTIYSELSRLYSNEIKNRNAADKERKEYANGIVDDAVKVMKAGLTFDNIDDAKDALQYATPAKQKEFAIQYSAKKIVDSFKMYSLPEQEKLVAEAQASGMIGANIVDAEVLATIETNLKERKAKAVKDPISLGVAEGRLDPTPAMNVSNGIGVISEVMPLRMKMRSANMLEYGDQADKLFTDAEASQWSAYLESPTTSPDEKIAFIEALPTEALKPALLQLQKKEAHVFSFIGGLVSEGKKETAKKVLRGQTILRELKGVVDMERVTWSAYGSIDNALKYSGEGDRKSLINSLIAYSAADAEDRGELNKGWTGADMKNSLNTLVNGIAKKNEQSYFLPEGATENDVEDWLDGVDFANTLPEIAHLTKEQAVDIIRQGDLVSVGNGVYAVKVKETDRFLKTTDGKNLKIKYPQ